ncbi:uncharacterized protein LOC133848494 [Drosophila sulfurigaster albostrigata]|uniref:uncharacterized protein LOC133848494 n=1 Tax=Drosophila sulfurigaster albostrigata TaxID=89887 RepID=UPI002D21DA2A|nr:uncharacterized protein LOC133848494 [Drosophila sulfurigaster albostrigata]
MSKRSSTNSKNHSASTHSLSYLNPHFNDARFLVAYKKAHASDSPEDVSTLASITRRDKFCKKCFLTVELCHYYAKRLEMPKEGVANLQSKDINVQPNGRKEKAEIKAEEGIEGGAEEHSKGAERGTQTDEEIGAHGGVEKGEEEGSEGGKEAEKKKKYRGIKIQLHSLIEVISKKQKI